MKRLTIRKTDEDEEQAVAVEVSPAQGGSAPGPAAPQGAVLDQVPIYEELFRLLLTVHERSMHFPNHELTELGADLRRAANAAAAAFAEGWGSRDARRYDDAIRACMGKVQETLHHLSVARRKGYLDEGHYQVLQQKYDECLSVLDALNQSLARWLYEGAKRTEETPGQAWQEVVNVTMNVLRVFA
ncbi:MAG: hypothetical protein A3K19_26655 [Lentisphaerae bacterium RIFOXYB12_FULL_65_16]|nr:MAG: hypothetical protein A3K18_18330 [Lentisphaerae bacterium RIFOXYA12_64_32]OGV86355.1 MAG: hypothetical protein A3K19_26655 [Lentisphaerae bacterium RIFOXYB12_FULL_65_16]